MPKDLEPVTLDNICDKTHTATNMIVFMSIATMSICNKRTGMEWTDDELCGYQPIMWDIEKRMRGVGEFLEGNIPKFRASAEKIKTPNLPQKGRTDL